MLIALDYFDDQGWINLKPEFGLEVFDILNSNFDIDATAQRFALLFKRKEENEITRLHDMLEIFKGGQCLAKSLSSYFGETLDEDCGKCTVCLDGGPIQFIPLGLQKLSTFDFDALVKPLVDVTQSPIPVDMATRFLCGISTPRLIKYKAKSMEGFGTLKSYPYRSVEEWVQSKL